VTDHIMVQDPEDCVASVIKSMIPTTKSAGIEYYKWLTMVCEQRPKFKDAIKLISNQPAYMEHFAHMLGDYTDLAVAVFPETAKLLDGAQDKFLHGRKSKIIQRLQEFQFAIIARRAAYEAANENWKSAERNINDQEWAALAIS
jgi:hypothetical protein